MVRALTAAAMILLLASSPVLAAEKGYQELLNDPAAKAADQSAEISKEFQTVVKLLEQAAATDDAEKQQKAYEDARTALDKVIKMNPSPELVRTLRDKIKEQVITQAFLKAPADTLDTIKAFLKIAAEGRKQWLTDPDRIAALVKQLVEGDFDKMWLAIYELKTAGQHAAPQLVQQLIDGDRDTRTKVTMALIASGRPVVLPLSEALNVSDNTVKQQILFALAEIQDERALPALAKLAVTTESTAIKEDALKAIRTITKNNDLQQFSAPQFYVNTAKAYYEKRFEVQQQAFNEFIIWNWNADEQKLEGRQVPEYAFYLEMAEKFCYDAISIDPYFDNAYPLLLCVYYQEQQTYSSLLAKADADTAEEVVADIKARKERVDEILRTAPALGRRAVEAACKLALNEEDTNVAVQCTDTLKKYGSFDENAVAVGSTEEKKRKKEDVVVGDNPLYAALNADSKAVRYHAAATLAESATAGFPFPEKVINILCQALGERGARVVLVADADVQVINQLKGILKGDQYIVDTAGDATGALKAGYAVPMKDALFVDASFDKAIESFIADYRTRNVPVILLTNDFNREEAVEKYGNKIDTFLNKPIDRSKLSNILAEIFVGKKEDTAVGVALNFNIMAAKALASVDLSTTSLPMMDAVNALVRALDLPDSVRLNAMEALSKIAPASGTVQGNLRRVAVDTENSLDARLAALDALTSIAARHKSLDQDVKEATVGLLTDKDPAVRAAAARLIGTSGSSIAPVMALVKDANWVK